MKKTLKQLSLLICASLTALLLFSCNIGADGGNDPAPDSTQNKVCTVTFVDGDAVQSTADVQYGATVKRPETPSRTGYTFGGWYNGDTAWNFASDKVTESVTLTAKWTPLPLSVAFNSDNGTPPVRQSVNYGETLAMPEDPVKSSFVFIGWYSGDALWNADSPVTENMTLIAKWVPEFLTVTFDSNGGSAIAPVKVAYSEGVAEPSAPTKTDSTFLGWYFGGELYDFSTPITEDITITAKWRSDYVTVSFQTGGGSNVASQKIAYGASATCPADPTRATYTFVGWYHNGKPFDFSSPIHDSVVLNAKWEEILITVTFDTAGGAILKPMTIHMGTALGSATTPSRPDYYFDGWLLNGESYDPSTPINESVTLTAKWITLQENQWRGYEDILDADTYAALKTLYDYYDGDAVIDWMASLWDGRRGAFYYSNSARDHYNYFPDIESTHQIMGWLTSNGAMTTTDLNTKFPNELKLQMVEFARNMQSASDGYFYHPQWPQGTANLNTDRYGRDLSWCESMFSRFTVDTNGDGKEEKQYPNYCTPGGVKCKTHASSGSCSFAKSAGSFISSPTSNITTSLGTLVSAAVSNVASSFVSPVVSSQPDYSSSAAFTKWLEEYNANIKNDSGNAHNINALQSEIIAKGYCDELLDYLDRIQREIYNEQLTAKETPTGLWQKPINYRAVWGLLKYAPFYNNSTYGREIKYAKEIVATAIKVIELPPDGAYYMNDVYNQWSCINSLISNVKKYNPDTLEDIYKMLRAKAPSLIENSLAKITPFKNANGAFGYTSTGNSLSGIYGVPISLGVVESDVNATVLCCSMYRCIFTCLGYTAVPLCTSEDGTRFVETLSAVNARYHDFEDGIDSSVSFEDKTGEGYMSVVTDPKNSSNSVLEFHSVTTSLTNSDRVRFNNLGGSGNCCVFESDMYLKSSSDDGYLFQIKMGDVYMITLHKSGSTVSIKETYSTGSSTSSDLTTTKTNTWFRLRVEYYTGAATGGDPVIRVFLDDKLVKTTSGYFGSLEGKAPQTAYTYISFYSMRAYKTDILIDNCYFAKENKIYFE